MRQKQKPVFFIVLAVILLLTYVAFFGLHSYYGDISKGIAGAGEIRWGIDIRGGVDATFQPDTTEIITNENIPDSYKEYYYNRHIQLFTTAKV